MSASGIFCISGTSRRVRRSFYGEGEWRNPKIFSKSAQYASKGGGLRFVHPSLGGRVKKILVEQSKRFPTFFFV
jgi:hypothetical protein